MPGSNMFRIKYTLTSLSFLYTENGAVVLHFYTLMFKKVPSAPFLHVRVYACVRADGQQQTERTEARAALINN